MPGQWEFQIGPSVGISAANELWVARCILQMNRFTGENNEGLDGDDEALRLMKSSVAVSNCEQRRMLLTRVGLKMVRGTRNEMTLIRWLLNTSPVLQEMNIQFNSLIAYAWKLADLNGFQRASGIAQIILQDVTSS
ncbi:Glutamine synthetase N-1 [Linum perenne]